MVQQRGFRTLFIRTVLGILVRYQVGVDRPIYVLSVHVRLVRQVPITRQNKGCGQAQIIRRSKDVRNDFGRGFISRSPQRIVASTCLQVSGRPVFPNQLTRIRHVQERSGKVEGNRRLVFQNASAYSRQDFLRRVSRHVVRLGAITGLREARMDGRRSNGSITGRHA